MATAAERKREPDEAVAHVERFLALALFATMFVVPLILRGDTPYALDVKWPVLGGGAVLCAAGLLLWWAFGGRLGPATRPVVLALVAYVAAVLVSTFRTVHLETSYRELWWTGARAVLFVAAVVAGRRWPVAFAAVFIVAVALVAGGGVGQRFGWDPYGFSWNKGGPTIDLRHARILSTIGLETALGGYLAVGAVFAAGVAVWVAIRKGLAREERQIGAAVSGVAAVLAVAAMILSGTRGAWFAFVLGMIVLGWALWPMAARLLRHTLGTDADTGALVIVAAVLVLVLGVLLTTPIGERIRELPGHLSVRTTIWKAALRMTAARPATGQGPGTFRRQFPFYRPADYAAHRVGSATIHAHSEYLDILAETGLLGGVTFAIFIGLFVVGSVRVLRGATGPPRVLLAAAFAAAVTMLLHATVQVDTRYPTCLMVLWVLLGFTVSRWERPAPRTPTHIGAKLVVGAAFVLAVAGTCAAFVLTSYTARKVLRRAMSAAAANDWKTAARKARWARDLDPTLCEAYREEARAGLRAGRPAPAWDALIACHSGAGPHYYDTDLYFAVACAQRGDIAGARHWLAVARQNSVAYGDFWRAHELTDDQLRQLADQFARTGAAYLPKAAETSRPVTTAPVAATTTPPASTSPPRRREAP
jgi:hypothetical protein